MSKTVLIEHDEALYAEEFVVGTFVTIRYPGKESRPDTETFLAWINDLAEKGLIFHSEYNCDYVFRVDGAVIEQLKEKLKLSEDSIYAYAGEDTHGNSAYKASTTMFLHLDGDLVSEVPIP